MGGNSEKAFLDTNTTNFLPYKSGARNVSVEVVLSDQSVWLTQKAMSEIFAVGIPSINKHLKNFFEDRELDKPSTVSILEIVQNEGGREVKRKIEYYNLDAIISVGYRVNSHQATQFRIWATKTLREFMRKGFVLDDDRLKQGGQVFGKDYFDELLEYSVNTFPHKELEPKMTQIYTLEIELHYEDEGPKLWKRTIEIPEDASLSCLHYYIQRIIEFGNDHLYEFYASATGRVRTKVFSESEDALYFDFDYSDVLLNQVFPLGRLKLFYRFDFGTPWLFVIKKLRKKKFIDANIEYPRVIESQGKNPDQYPIFDDVEGW